MKEKEKRPENLAVFWYSLQVVHFFLTLKSEWNSCIFVKHTNQTHAIVQFKWLHSEIGEKQSQKPFNKKNESDKA